MYQHRPIKFVCLIWPSSAHGGSNALEHVVVMLKPILGVVLVFALQIHGQGSMQCPGILSDTCTSAAAQTANSTYCEDPAQDLSTLRGIMLKIEQELLENPMPRRCPRRGARGIATSVGTQRHVDNAYASLRDLRFRFGSALPVSVFHWSEVSSDVVQLFQETFGNSVEFVDLSKLKSALRTQKCSTGQKPDGFVVKALAVYHALSHYEHLLWMDADNFILADPAKLFTSEQYVKHGNVFWPDYWNSWVDHEIYDVLTEQRHGPSQFHDTESGQLLLNTCKHQDVLEYVLALNEHSGVTYNYMYGDKDTFRLAFALAGKLQEYWQVRHSPGSTFTTMEASTELTRVHNEAIVMQSSDEEHHDVFQVAQERCRLLGPAFMVGMLQASPSGEPQFLHRTNAEFSVLDLQQIQSEFVLAPRPSREMDELLWQVPYPGASSDDHGLMQHVFLSILMLISVYA